MGKTEGRRNQNKNVAQKGVSEVESSSMKSHRNRDAEVETMNPNFIYPLNRP